MAPKTVMSRMISIKLMIKPAIAKPRGFLNRPMIEKMAPRTQTIQPTTGIKPTIRDIKARIKPVRPIPFLLRWSTITTWGFCVLFSYIMNCVFEVNEW